jgi:glycosyltransferase involved in cell wall biosynthesis
MIIGIDASRALRSKRTGTERYNAEIIKQLVSLDKVNTYRLYSNIPPDKSVHSDLVDLPGNVEWRIMPFGLGWTLIRLSWEMLVNPPDILFVPAHTLPLIRPKKSVVTIHDIAYEHFPELFSAKVTWYHRFVMRIAKYGASHIITDTAFTKQDLHDTYKIPLTKMTVVPLGFSATDFHPKKTGEKSPSDVPYFYYVGTIEAKKNIVRMMEAFTEFKAQTGLPHKFYFAGRLGFGYDEIQKTHDLLGPYKDDVVFLSYVSQEDATRYLNHAEALVFTTLFEGFGLPILEGFASEVPVITSNVTSMPEVAGDAALLVDPRKASDIADAMTKIAQDKSLRDELIKKGRARLEHFSWKKITQQTLDILEQTAQK